MIFPARWSSQIFPAASGDTALTQVEKPWRIWNPHWSWVFARHITDPWRTSMALGDPIPGSGSALMATPCSPEQVRHSLASSEIPMFIYIICSIMFILGFLKDHSGHDINYTWPRIPYQRIARLAQACSNLRRDSWSLGEAEAGVDFAEHDWWNQKTWPWLRNLRVFRLMVPLAQLQKRNDIGISMVFVQVRLEHRFSKSDWGTSLVV